MIKEYLDKIIQGDTLTILKKIPDNSIDIGVTSPPYNKRKARGVLVKEVDYNGVSDDIPEEEYQKKQIAVLNELYRIIKPGGSFFYNHKTRWQRGHMIHPMDWLRKTEWVIRQEIIWDRIIAGNIRGWRFWQVEERIYWLYKPVGKKLIGEELKSRHALLTSIWRFPPDNNNPHPAAFPLILPIRCIYSIFGDERGKIVIDPYAGSGTTLVAAKLLGHQYIGIDLVQEYIDLALERLESFDGEQNIMDDEINLHVVRKSYKERKKEKGDRIGETKSEDE